MSNSTRPPEPWFAGSAASDGAKAHAPATLRNRGAILEVLHKILPDKGNILEVASGSGEHILYFGEAFPRLHWIPSDPDPAALSSIAAWRAEQGGSNIAPPLSLNASAKNWPELKADAILCINMAHISPWAATCGLFRHAASILSEGAPLMLYGPFFEEGITPSDGNVAFDRALKERNADYAVRFVGAIDAEAAVHGFARTGRFDMPANNLTLIYRR